MQIDVYPLPDLVPRQVDPDAAVFIDVLRATSTMTVALGGGANRIIPVADPQETLRLKARMIADGALAANETITGGERGGIRVDGFDLGNSPCEYTPEVVAGKTIFFSTTNGTRAILSLKSGRTKKFLGSFLAADALVNRLLSDGTIRSIALICAGTDRQYTEEDMLLAGMLTDRLAERLERSERASESSAEAPIRLNTVAETVRWQWRQLVQSAAGAPLENEIAARLKQSRGGKNLVRVGLARDIPDVARLNRFDAVAEYKLGEIRLVR